MTLSITSTGKSFSLDVNFARPDPSVIVYLVCRFGNRALVLHLIIKADAIYCYCLSCTSDIVVIHTNMVGKIDFVCPFGSSESHIRSKPVI